MKIELECCANCRWLYCCDDIDEYDNLEGRCLCWEGSDETEF